LAVTGGAHTAEDAIKSIMCGATAVQMVSAVLKHGPEHIKKVRDAMKSWMEEHQYTSVSEMRGSMNLAKCPDATVFERSNYVKILKSGFSG
jgi:dihydroorotate dehydrogenase (fumarate)